jgi:hypothetical protein
MHHTLIDVHGHRRIGKSGKTCLSNARPAQIGLIRVEADIFGLIVETIPVLGRTCSRSGTRRAKTWSSTPNSALR